MATTAIDAVGCALIVPMRLLACFRRAMPVAPSTRSDVRSQTIRSRPIRPMPTSQSSRHRWGSAARRCATLSRCCRVRGWSGAARRYGTRVLPVEDWNLLDGDVVGWHRRDHPGSAASLPRRRRRLVIEPATTTLVGGPGGRARRDPGRCSTPPTQSTPKRTTCRRSSTPTAVPRHHTRGDPQIR